MKNRLLAGLIVFATVTLIYWALIYLGVNALMQILEG